MKTILIGILKIIALAIHMVAKLGSVTLEAISDISQNISKKLEK